MPFYKRENQSILTAKTRVVGPDLNLLAEEHETYQYPIKGWYWFDTLDDALVGLRPPQLSVTPRQARLALYQTGLLDPIAAWIAQADAATRIEWEFALEIRRDWPPIQACATALGLTEEQLDGLFAVAATL